MTMNEEWISAKQAAELSGYNEEYVRRLLRTGKIKGRKFVTVWQVHRPSFMSYLEASEESEDKRRSPRD